MKFFLKIMYSWLLIFCISIQILHGGNRIDQIKYAEAITNQRIDKTNSWKDSRYLSGGPFLGKNRIAVFTAELKQIKLIPKSLTAFDFFQRLLTAWSNYLDRAFFSKPYTAEKADILEEFMENYIKELFTIIKNYNNFRPDIRQNIVKNYYEYCVNGIAQSLDSTTKQLIALINARIKKIKKWIQKGEQWRISGKFLASYKTLQKKYDNEVVEYNKVLSKLVKEFESLIKFEQSSQKTFPYHTINAFQNLKLLDNLTQKLFSHTLPQLCVTWKNFFEKFTWKNTDKKALEHYRNHYLKSLEKICANFDNNINALITNDAPVSKVFLEKISTDINSIQNKIRTIENLINSKLTPEYEGL